MSVRDTLRASVIVGENNKTGKFDIIDLRNSIIKLKEVGGLSRPGNDNSQVSS